MSDHPIFAVCLNTGHYGAGSLSLLTGPLVTSLVQDITLAGQQVRGPSLFHTITSHCVNTEHVTLSSGARLIM